MFLCMFNVLGTNRQSSVYGNSSSHNIAPIYDKRIEPDEHVISLRLMGSRAI